jgi:uncharacterized protein DUF1275
MGIRNAAVRKLAIPDLTPTVLTLTITDVAADSSLANGKNPGLAMKVESIAAMFLGAGLGAVVIHYSMSVALWLATAIFYRVLCKRWSSLSARPISCDSTVCVCSCVLDLQEAVPVGRAIDAALRLLGGRLRKA